jgi:AcrR family transcriptional regulator
MAIRSSLDVATRISSELSAFIEKLVDDPDREEAPTLEAVRAALQESSSEELWEDDLRHPQDRESMIVELNALIEEFGPEALAAAFVSAKASEALSRVIESAVTEVGRRRRPTLGAVREAMLGGLTARLIGDGAIEADEDNGALLAEIDELIRRFGKDTPAEMFVRFE